MDEHSTSPFDDTTGKGAVSPALASGPGGFLAPPVGLEWYAEREERNAEPFVRDDASILTAEAVDEASITSLCVELRVARGSGSPALFHDIAAHLASLRGAEPDIVEGVGHAIYHHPDAVARYILVHSG